MNPVTKLSDRQTAPDTLLQTFSDLKWGADRLAAVPVFKCFSHEELTTLYKNGRVICLSPGAHAVIEGENTRGVFLILSGSFSVFKTDQAAGTMHRIAHLSEGQYFGEISLFDKAPRSATVAADVLSYLFSLDASGFEAFLQSAGEAVKARFYQACAEDLSGRFRLLNTDYINSQQILWKYALRRSDSK